MCISLIIKINDLIDTKLQKLSAAKVVQKFTFTSTE